MQRSKKFCVMVVICGLSFFTSWIFLDYDPHVWKIKAVQQLGTKLSMLFDDVTEVSGQCIEVNICKNLTKSQAIYYYKRTDFYTRLARPVDFSINVNHSQPVVPRKVHFILFSNGTLTFKFHYLIAMMAASRFAKPEKMYFWHDNLPMGEYWEEAKRRVKNLYLVQRERPTSIFGQNVSVVEHAADIARLEALLEYGGMYFDTDSIVVKPIDPFLIYDVTMCHTGAEVLSNGVLFSKSWSEFFKIWYKEYKTFEDSNWGGHSVLLPFSLSRRFPSLIHVEPSSLCRPSYMFFYREYLRSGTRTIWDWQHKNHAVHLYMRCSKESGRSPEEIKYWATTAGSIMRYIYFSNATLQHRRRNITVVKPTLNKPNKIRKRSSIG